jgi:TetR/AcrR family transcriptional regulator
MGPPLGIRDGGVRAPAQDVAHYLTERSDNARVDFDVSSRELQMARPRAADYDTKRRLILDAAGELFAANGFGNTSIAMLSGAAGGSKAWIYHYYESKEAILFDLLASHMRGLLDTVRAADDPALAPRERLTALVTALLHAYADADATHQVRLNELMRLTAEQQEEIRGVEREVVRVVADVLAAARPALSERPDVLTPLTMSLFGMLNWHHRWFRPTGPMSLDTYAGLVVGMVFDGLAGVPLAGVPQSDPAVAAAR